MGEQSGHLSQVSDKIVPCAETLSTLCHFCGIPVNSWDLNVVT